MGFKVKKRTKVRRYRGSKGHGGGFRQKRRGKGNKGGKGMSGTGKRSSQKMGFGQMLARKNGVKDYFGSRGFTSVSTAQKENNVLNLEDVRKIYAEEKEIKLEDYKILGEGEGFKATINAKSASKSAIEKMEKAGGKIIVSKKEQPSSEEKAKKEAVKEKEEKAEKKPVAKAKKAEVKK